MKKLTKKEIKKLKEECKNVEKGIFDKKYYHQMLEMFRNENLTPENITFLTGLTNAKVINNNLELTDLNGFIIRLSLDTFNVYIENLSSGRIIELRQFIESIIRRIKTLKEKENTIAAHTGEGLLLRITTIAGIAYTMASKAKDIVNDNFFEFDMPVKRITYC